MDCALIATWTRPYPGREQLAIDFYGQASEFYGKLAAEGKCTAPEMFYLSGWTMWMVKGDRAVLEEAFFSDEGQGLNAQGMLLLDKWTVELALADEASMRQFLRWGEEAHKLGIIPAA